MYRQPVNQARDDENLITTDGDLDRLWAPVALVPLGESVRIEHGRVIVEPAAFAEAHNGRQRVTSTAGLLDGFLDLQPGQFGEPLATARVWDFVARWGLMDGCSHGLWSAHGSMEMPVALGSPVLRLPVDRECRGWAGEEPVDVWQFWVEQAKAIVAIANRLREVEPDTRRDEAWDVLLRPGPWVAADTADRYRRGLHRPPGHHETQRMVIAGAVMAWLEAGAVTTALSWQTGTSATIQPAARSLLGGLGLQLALATTGHDRWWQCGFCGHWFTPDRKPRHDRGNYCDPCKEAHASKKMADDRFNAKRRAKRKGVPPG